jgi:UDP-hydrolysing UDP-N-acetyl-D-glucosamine 2-epimerase
VGDVRLRNIAVVTVGRSDYGIYIPVLRAIERRSDLSLRILASGAHLSPEFGHTVDVIVADGFKVDEKLTTLLSADTPQAIAASTGLAVIAFAQSFAQNRPDILVVLGDRFEMYAAALAALPFAIPVAHIHGGEVTEGAIDEALRHSMTKLSHLHFVATDEYARRVVQLGEEPWRVTVSGAPALDDLDSMEYLSTTELEKRFGIVLDPLPLLVTFHPATLQFENVEAQMRELLAGLEASGEPVLFTMPNADTNGRVVMRMIDEYVQARSNAQVVVNFGRQAYFSMMRRVRAMVGNSSSGIVEASSFGLPVVNVGDRQRGRMRASNVIDVPNDRARIAEAIERALSPAFHERCKNGRNPYRANRPAGEVIAERLATVALDDRLRIKTFQDLPAESLAR